MALHILFYIFATVAVGSAIAVITAKNPVRSVLSLVITFFAMAAIWMMLRAEFLSLTLLLVYVGAVMTLFLFVVMMLNIDREAKQSGFVQYLPYGIILVLMMFGLMVVALSPHYFGLTHMPIPPNEPADFSNTAELGTLLFTQYNYPFEIAGVILLAAMIAAITLTHRKIRRRAQNVSEQVNVQKKDRLRIIKMSSEPKKGSST
jgi:NADH-quinone oxidoreductase subunit J